MNTELVVLGYMLIWWQHRSQNRRGWGAQESKREHVLGSKAHARRHGHRGHPALVPRQDVTNALATLPYQHIVLVRADVQAVGVNLDAKDAKGDKGGQSVER